MFMQNAVVRPARPSGLPGTREHPHHVCRNKNSKVPGTRFFLPRSTRPGAVYQVLRGILFAPKAAPPILLVIILSHNTAGLAVQTHAGANWFAPGGGERRCGRGRIPPLVRCQPEHTGCASPGKNKRQQHIIQQYSSQAGRKDPVHTRFISTLYAVVSYDTRYRLVYRLLRTFE